MYLYFRTICKYSPWDTGNTYTAFTKMCSTHSAQEVCFVLLTKQCTQPSIWRVTNPDLHNESFDWTAKSQDISTQNVIKMNIYCCILLHSVLNTILEKVWAVCSMFVFHSEHTLRFSTIPCVKLKTCVKSTSTKTPKFPLSPSSSVIAKAVNAA